MYESFENGDYICEEDIKLVQNYICGNLNSFRLIDFITTHNITMSLNYTMFANGEASVEFLLLQKRDRQFVTVN